MTEAQQNEALVTWLNNKRTGRTYCIDSYCGRLFDNEKPRTCYGRPFTQSLDSMALIERELDGKAFYDYLEQFLKLTTPTYPVWNKPAAIDFKAWLTAPANVRAIAACKALGLWSEEP